VKKAAAILLLIFTLVQAGPLVRSIFASGETTVFAVNEKKSPEKPDIEKKKEKKDFTAALFANHWGALTRTPVFPADSGIPTPAFAENHTPPPDFC